KAFQNMLTGNMAINGIGLLMCTSKRQTCEQTCTDLQAKFDMSKQRLATVCANKYSGLVDNNCSSEVHKAESNAKEAKKMVVLCDDLSNEQIGQGMQISALGVAQKLSGECSDATTEQSTDFPEYADTGNLFSGDCSNPAFFNHPTCIACRKDPSQASCKGLVGLSSEDTVAYDPGGDVQSADASSYAKDVGLNGQGDDDLDVGDPGGVAGAGAGLAQTASAGGGGGGLGGGSGIAALGTSGGGGGGSKKGYNTDILKGARGGGGYVSKMGFNSPSGYSSRGGSGSQAKRDSFNLKDFLPGGKKYKGKERGLASASGLVGKNTLPPSVNIFERLSHRFHRQCKKGTFLNCGPTYWENRRKTWHSGQQW
ncbi:MAG: hypothetical protein KDD50_15655, partial [Bdellovibrionales bacterium]|nr:hypothetical protein [Bdellovibrionales bacterium]